MSQSSHNNLTSANAGIDQLVKEYLKEKGYHKALEAMEFAEKQKKESQKDDQVVPLYQPADSDGMGEEGKPMDIDDDSAAADKNQSSRKRPVAVPHKVMAESLISNKAASLYVIGIREGDPNVYLEEYGQFHHWTSQSIDLVSPYLEAVGFAAFITCYVGLIRMGFIHESQQLWSLYHSKYTHMFQEELHYTALLQTPIQLVDTQFLSSNPFLPYALKEKFIIQMSQLAFAVLSHYLSENGLVLITAIVNDRIQFEKSKFPETIVNIDSNELIQLNGYSPSGINSLELELGSLGVPGTGETLRDLQAKSALYESVTIPSITSSVPNNNTATSSYLQHYKPWLISLVRPREILEKRNKRRRQMMIRQREREEHGGGVGFAKEDEEADQQRDFFTSLHVNIEDKDGGEGNGDENNRPMGDALEPSVIFATIGNTNEGLNCLAMNESINQVVTGHHDSIVRVWRLDQTEDHPDLVFGQALREYLGKNSWELDDVRPKLPHVYDRQQQQQQPGNNGNGLDLAVVHNNGNSSSNSNGGNRGIVSSSSSSSNRYPMLEFVGHDLPIFAVDQSKSGRVIASSSADETIRLWDTSVIQCVSKIRCTSVAWDIKFHPFDYYFATAHANRSVSLYTTDQVTPLRLMTGHSSDVNCLAWHPNAFYLASGSDDRSVRFWDIRNAECVKLFRGCGSAVSSVAISPIGNLIAAGAESGNIYLWDIRSSKQLAILNGHEGSAYSVAFNANGTVLSSGGKDCSVRIWDLAPAIFPGYNESTTSSFEKGPYRLIRPKHSFFTKASPVYHVGITGQNLVYAGGPCSLDAATYGTGGMDKDTSNTISSEKELTKLMNIKGVKPSH